MLAFCHTPTPLSPVPKPLSPSSSGRPLSVSCLTRASLRQTTFTQTILAPYGPHPKSCQGLTMEVATHHVPTLYHVPWFCSSIPYQLILELSIPSTSVDVITISEAQLRTSSEIEFLSPRRVVPFMAFPDGSVLFEAGAIVLYICETFDNDFTLHPAPGDPRRSRFFQGVVYAVAEAYGAVMDIVLEKFDQKNSDIDQDRATKLRDKFRTVVVEHLVLELEEQGRPYYLGDNFSAVDILFGYILMTAIYLDADLIQNNFVKEYHQRVTKRSACEKLFSRAAASQE